MKRSSKAKLKRAWLLTWEWLGDHAQVKDKFVAIISSRYGNETVKSFIEQYYTSNYLAWYEQISYAKSKKHCPYKVQSGTVNVSATLQKEASLPPYVLFSDSMMIGGNPWLWGRIVYDVESGIDQDGIEYLKWIERKNLIWDGDKVLSDWEEFNLKRE